ncbi:2-C-methyl-D-erythritol 4-phosphate cytidylyltransferase [Oceanobacter sp. 3_MG-2023]|uniref:2-C-methyl-D-erythritol 4-phosphate cytidylyltransferase n=1 Tax=Oceanobacter sp. 3_MG-2023 TaxID=3062622 RepID=UPI0027354D21|nr:2-C-methyl-D-erythritol 4-phosphate cytidylyltransferase [Oceanobacter sp. 3_MG-2023]MDP2505701.1 2-C-methyl-D-erythritol 4-phosphate cytidylyltransferase [Oceanobacter sp. 3_MG-2023]
MTIWPLVVAAGVGRRMQADRPKQYLRLNQRLLMDYTLDTLLTYPGITRLVLVLSEYDPYWPDSEFADNARILRACGGAERCDSVLNGLRALQTLAAEDDWVMVHDVARPCLQHSDLDALLEALCFPGAILASPTRDTMKRGRINAQGQADIVATVEREQLWHALTPQVFPLGLLIQALEYCRAEGLAVTDEASAVEHLGYAPRLVEGRADNIKVTRPADLALVAFYLQQTSESDQAINKRGAL